MDYTTLCAESKQDQEQVAKRLQSLSQVCQQLVDGRCARGKRYDLAGLLVVLVLAKLAGMQSLLGASDWAQDQQAFLRQGLALSWKRMPCANTSSYALERLDSHQVNAALAAWRVRQEAESRCGEEPSRLVAQPSERHVHLAVDGKALRGTGKQLYGGEEPQKPVLHVDEAQTGIVLPQCPIAKEHKEVSTLKPLLTQVLCKGRILSSDGAQSSHDGWRAWSTKQGVMWCCSSKTILQPPARIWNSFLRISRLIDALGSTREQVEKGHGRLERGQIPTSPDLNDASRAGTGARWDRSARVQRERQSKDKRSVEVVSGWTTLSLKRGSPERLSQVIRAHWAVENRLHWRRHVTLGEDRCGVRFPPVAQMLAVLNTVVLSLMDLHQVPNVARQIRRFASHPDEALAWVL
jgi:predicted transposase YbfD/YdcC